MQARPSGALLVLIVSASVVVATFSWYSLTQPSALQISVQLPVYDVDGIGVGSQLVVKVSNAGVTPIEPEFWVMWSVFVRNWERLDGPEILMPGITALYVIRSPYAQMSVPNGNWYIVKILDRASGVYFRSNSLRLDLSGSPPIRNPGLRFWSRDVGTGVFKPFAWSFDSRFGPGDEGSATPANGSSGVRLWLHASGTGTVPSFVQVQQAVGTSDVPRLRSASVSLCWAQAINYTSEPTSGYPLAASGVGLYTSNRIVWLVFSRTLDTVVDLPNHRIIVIRAPVDQPVCAPLPMEQLVDFLGGSSLTTLTFVIFAVVWPNLPGDHVFAVTSLSFG